MENKIPEKIFEEIRESYLKEVSIPKTKPEKQFLLCPIGLVGAGKTTVIKPLAEKLNLVRISGDEIRKLFKEKGFGYDRVRELGNKIVEYFLQKGFSVAIDTDCVSEETQKNIEVAKENFDLKVIWIHINPPEEFILDKLNNLKPNWLGTAEEMTKNYFRRKPLHQSLNFDFTYIFDTSKDNLEEQIEEAQKIIKKQ